jgi:hypothetical protein
MKSYERVEPSQKSILKTGKVKDYHMNHPIKENETCFGKADDRVLHTLKSENKDLVKLTEIQTSTGDIIVSKDLDRESVFMEFTQKTNVENTANDYEDDHFPLDHSTTKKADTMNIWLQTIEKNMTMIEGEKDHKYQHYKKSLDKLKDQEIDTGAIDTAAPTMDQSNHTGLEAARDLAIENKVNKAIEKGKALSYKSKNDDFPELLKKRLVEMEEENKQDDEEEEGNNEY